MRRNLFWLNDEQWRQIEPHLPKDVRGKDRVDDRRVISGILHVLKSGCRWCDCPSEYGPPTTIYKRFVRWAERGVWERLFRELAGRGRSTDTQMIDSTYIKAHRSASGANVWPAPSQVVFGDGMKQPAQTYRAFRLCRWPRWRSARSGPHKGGGIEVPFCAIGFRNTDRLSGHLTFNHSQTSVAGETMPADLSIRQRLRGV